MTTLVFPINIEPGVDMLEQMRHMTDDEFFYFCQENSDYKFERDRDGNFKRLAQTGGETSERNSELNAELVIWNRTAKSGYCYDSSGGFRLPNGAVRGPDAAWVIAERRNTLTPDQRKNFHPFALILSLS